MTVGEVLISREIKDHLGDSGVTEVTGWLWAVDCQTCGRPLDSDPPALCVDDMVAFAAASLHHEECRPPEWGQGPFVGLGNADHVTHRTRLVMLPVSGENSPAAIPVMLVNPSMELVILAQVDGRWHPQFNAAFTGVGMVPPGPQLRLYHPLPDAAAKLTRTGVTAGMPPASPTGSYECNIAEGEPFRGAIADEGGLLLAITHAVDPFAGDFARQFAAALQAGLMLFGWIPPSRA